MDRQGIFEQIRGRQLHGEELLAFNTFNMAGRNSRQAIGSQVLMGACGKAYKGLWELTQNLLRET